MIALEKLGESPGAGAAWAAWFVHVGRYEEAARLAMTPYCRLECVCRTNKAVNEYPRQERWQTVNQHTLRLRHYLRSMTPSQRRTAGIDALNVINIQPPPSRLRHVWRRCPSPSRSRVRPLTLWGGGVDGCGDNANLSGPGRTAALQVFTHVTAPELIDEFRQHAASDTNPDTRQAALDARRTSWRSGHPRTPASPR